jgi:hypothetical protein
MEKIRVSVVIESDADMELYNYLVNIPSRRRATLIRTFATQGMNSEGQLKIVSAKIQTKSIVEDSKNHESKIVKLLPESKSPHAVTNENEKEKALNKALVNLDFD